MKLCKHCLKRKSVDGLSWTVAPCALNRRVIHIPLCVSCDVKLNKWALDFIRYPWRVPAIAKYKAKLKAEYT